MKKAGVCPRPGAVLELKPSENLHSRMTVIMQNWISRTWKKDQYFPIRGQTKPSSSMQQYLQ